MNHQQWLEEEYHQWVLALGECTPLNCKDHPMVRRMLGYGFDPYLFGYALAGYFDDHPNKFPLLKKIDNIGFQLSDFPREVGYRHAHYALKVLARNPSHVVEIGAGIGQFYAVLRALGYQGTYAVYDIFAVQEFQLKYWEEVSRQVGLDLQAQFPHPDRDSYLLEDAFCVSFYALGEFTDEQKAYYVENVVKKCPHGLIIWNPHSGASPEVPFECGIEDEWPSTHEGNLELTW